MRSRHLRSRERKAVAGGVGLARALLVGYARCSTDQQDLTAQHLLGLGVEVERIYVDHGLTGTNRERPGLREALAACRARATTLSEAQQRADALRAELARRDVHPDVLHFCRAELVQQNYFHAVLEGAKSVAEKLRDLSDLQGDGAPLVDAACSLSSGPIVAFNALATDYERSEQTGFATLLKGLFGTFRNPTAHAPKVLWATSRGDALDMLTLASMLHRRLDAATVRKQ